MRYVPLFASETSSPSGASAKSLSMISSFRLVSDRSSIPAAVADQALGEPEHDRRPARRRDRWVVPPRGDRCGVGQRSGAGGLAQTGLDAIVLRVAADRERPDLRGEAQVG